MFAYSITSGARVRRQKSPLEDNVFPIPAGCTDVEPPNFDASTHTCVFDANQWIVTEIPVPEEEPTPEPISAMEQLRMQRNSLLVQTDWRMVSDYPGSNQAEWQTYRQVLRDITTQTPSLDSDGNLTGITWPTAPTD